MSNITEEYVEEYIRELLPEDKGLLKEIQHYAIENHIPIVHKEVAALLKVITKTSRSKKILEVGTAIGYSTILLCQAAGEDCHVTTIERDSERVEKARNNIKKADFTNNIQVIQGDAQEVLNFLDSKYDLIFLDGAKGHYKEMLNNCIDSLKVGGILVSDNILFKGMVANDDLVIRRKRTIVNRMRDYLHYICNHPQLDTTIIPIGDGVAISYRRLEE
ncbi:O-methyltransferase [Natronincola ferrireducens]|uniref:tRNA 5-hydroxyuridine methyltransferase n=1 Tax=Natronincola ferrireducens TaxID=393762 RepID=A0A1G9CMP6_9FIRM|nr:O-methyltransferase [Natronincola ferrireducens]SDK52927.1 Predicted O-methyltransferase YrrM [Natronincola ferrireducens]